MSDYRNLPIKLPNEGLDVTSPPDLLKEGKYTRLNNVKNSLEGVVTTRDGWITLFIINPIGVSNVHTIRRLDDSGIFFAMFNKAAYRNTTQILIPSNVSGHPFTTVRFKAALSGSSFLYVADSHVMFKVKTDGTVFKWGVTAPAAAPSFVGGTPGALDGDYDWRFTYYSTISGAESNGSPIAPQITLSNQSANITGMTPSTDPQVDQKRLYRRGGTITDTWQFVVQLSNATTDFIDTFSDDDIALNEPLSEDNEVPFTTVDSSGNTLFETPLPFIFGPFIGKYIMACGDPNRPGFVYWTNPDMPDSASSENTVSVTNPAEPLQGGFIFNENPYVWTKDNLYTLDYGGPDAIPTFIPRLVSIGIGLSAPYAYCVGNAAVIFMSKDGIYATDCQSQVKSITNEAIRPIFLGRQAGPLAPIDFTFQDDIRLFYASQEVHFFYRDTNGAFEHLVYDLQFDRWREFKPVTKTHNFGYGDENQSSYTLLLAESGTGAGIIDKIVPGATTDGGTVIRAEVRTGAQDAGVPLTHKEWGVLLLDADPNGGAIIVTPYTDAESVAHPSTTVTGTGRQIYSIPLGDLYSRNISFDFVMGGLPGTGPGTLYQLLVLFRVDEEPVTHWEHPETTHGTNMGWTHVRDAFFCVRSTQDITLTETIDGRPYTYILPSTSGERRRIHVYLAPVKGKVYKWEMNSPEVFKFYGEDSQIFVKQWNSALSYQPLAPFTAVGQATFLRKEAGT